MPGTFSQIYLQFVFAVQGQQHLIPKQYKEELHKYITSLVQARNAKMLAVHCMPGHAHLFVGVKPSVYIPDFIKEVKVESNEFIKEGLDGQLFSLARRLRRFLLRPLAVG